jgi:hypothetical protein
MCSLKTVFLACYSVKYDVRLVLNASTSSIFNKFDGKLFQSLVVLGKKLYLEVFLQSWMSVHF